MDGPRDGGAAGGSERRERGDADERTDRRGESRPCGRTAGRERRRRAHGGAAAGGVDGGTHTERRLMQATTLAYGFLVVWFAAVLVYGLYRSVTSTEDPLPLPDPPAHH